MNITHMVHKNLQTDIKKLKSTQKVKKGNG